MLQVFKKATSKALDEIRQEMKIRRTNEVMVLFSMGSQFDHLIKQSLEKLGVYCLVADPASVTAEDVKALKPIGIILSGGPASVHSEPPPFDRDIFDLNIPVLGICLGFQLWAQHVGLTVKPAEHREFGTHVLTLLSDRISPLFDGVPQTSSVLESHGDRVELENVPGITIHASTEHAPVAAANYQHLWGVQFHPEVTETEYGPQMFENFCFRICGAKDRFPAENIAQQKIAKLREQLAGKKVVLGLSAGADSSTVAYLLKHAQADVRHVYVKGIDRPDDERHVIKFFGDQPWTNLRIVDATRLFLKALKGIRSMRKKREAMRDVYRKILEREARAFGRESHVRDEDVVIAQGTLFTDISESGGGYATGARKAKIKQHHNVNLGFSFTELTPLDDCVKDGGRNIGRSIGVPEELLMRHPFPGPGLIVRIEGKITKKRLAIARAVDEIYIEELRDWNLYPTIWQAGAVVTKSVTTCTKGDDAVEGVVIALWAVWSVNGFTATRARLPDDFLDRVSQRITNEIREVGSVVYRISDKPPATIEWG